jgi:DNA (cytosine-5)-methyltransferase 1
LESLRSRTWNVDAIHASPPCQHYTALAKGNNANVDQYPDLIPPTRELLEATGLPYVIENVPTAPLVDPITLCGEMFGLGVIRHRKFESNMSLAAPAHVPHRGRVAGWRHGQKFDGPYFAVYGDGGGKGSVAEWQTAMGIDWADVRLEIAEAIPPAYTEHIGAQLIQALKVAA